MKQIIEPISYDVIEETRNTEEFLRHKKNTLYKHLKLYALTDINRSKV